MATTRQSALRWKVSKTGMSFWKGAIRKASRKMSSAEYDKEAESGRGRVLSHQPRAADGRLRARQEKENFGLTRGKKTIWEAGEYLNTLVDDSDPDTDLTQIEHLLQTSEAIRRDGHPRWMIATGFVHDLGKCLCLYGEPQWGVVGDTFPIGCAWSDQIVFPEYFAANPDRNVAEYQTIRHL